MTTELQTTQAETIFDWLRANGWNLGPLTGTDSKSLAAAVAVLELYSYAGGDDLLEAFAACVSTMQRSTRHLAYHAVASVLDWHDRETIWQQAGLEAIANPGTCRFER